MSIRRLFPRQGWIEYSQVDVEETETTTSTDKSQGFSIQTQHTEHTALCIVSSMQQAYDGKDISMFKCAVFACICVCVLHMFVYLSNCT